MTADRRPLLVELEGDTVRIDGRRYAAGSVQMQAALHEQRSRPLVLRAPPRHTLGNVVAVLDAARKAERPEVSLEIGSGTYDIRLHASPTSRDVLELAAQSNPASVTLWPLKPSADPKAPFPAPEKTQWQPGDTASDQALQAWLAQTCSGGRCNSLEYVGAPETPTEEAGALLERLRAHWGPVRPQLPPLELTIIPRESTQAPSEPTQAPSEPTQAPSEPTNSTQVKGRLPPRVIQSIVRRSFDSFRKCYEDGLARNSELSGRVSIRFIISKTGKVSDVSTESSDLPDPEVVTCVAKAFYGLRFPPPSSGIVTVVYPIMLSPG